MCLKNNIITLRSHVIGCLKQLKIGVFQAIYAQKMLDNDCGNIALKNLFFLLQCNLRSVMIWLIEGCRAVLILRQGFKCFGPQAWNELQMFMGNRKVAVVLLALPALGVLAIGCGAPARATLIIADGFSGTNGASLTGRTPDTADLPGGTYTSTGGSISTATGNPAPAFVSSSNGNGVISITSANSYIEPTSFTISADIEINDLTKESSGAYYRGVGLGFWTASQTGSTVSSNALVVNPSGSLSLTENGSSILEVSAFNGFSTGQFYNLSYTVDTANGSISDVIFNGNNDSSYFTGLTNFTAANTPLAGFYGTSSTGVTGGYVDNFQVSTVPEPTELGLLAVGGLGLLLEGRKRKFA